MPLRLPFAALIALLGLQGCMARAAFDTATAPVRIAEKVLDLATTTRSEADERRGRELRQREERLGKLERSARHHAAQCADGHESACRKRDAEEAEIARLLPSIPIDPE